MEDQRRFLICLRAMNDVGDWAHPQI